MENYIVRICRRDDADPNKLTGVFESVERETRDTFKTVGRLMSLISPQTAVADDDATVDDSIPEIRRKAVSLSD